MAADTSPHSSLTTNPELTRYKETEAEWDDLAEVTPQFADKKDVESTENTEACSTLVTFDQVYEYINSGVLDTYLSQVTEPRKTGLDLMFACLCSLRPLPPHLENSKQSVLATALIPFLNEEPIHLHMLRTLHRQLTGARFDCPRYGHHWEDIGFQRNDPATDLRGVGVLGLVQALYLVITPEILPFARDVYQLSLKESQEFPLMVLSLNVTRICLHILRDGLIDRQCQSDDNVWSSINYLYAAVMYHIYHIWKTQHKTISSSGFVLKDAEEAARKSPQRLMDAFEHFLSSSYSVAEKQTARTQINRDSNRSKTTGPDHPG